MKLRDALKGERLRWSEAEFQTEVIRMAKASGWLVNHQRPAINQSGRWSTAIQGHAGFPDLVMVRGTDLIFAELKSQKGRLAGSQLPWLTALQDFEEATYAVTMKHSQMICRVWRAPLRGCFLGHVVAASRRIMCFSGCSSRS